MGKKNGFSKRVSDWWHGEFKVRNDPNVISLQTERHWTSEIAHTIANFYLTHWQWVWGTVLAVVGVWIAWMGLRL